MDLLVRYVGKDLMLRVNVFLRLFIVWDVFIKLNILVFLFLVFDIFGNVV